MQTKMTLIILKKKLRPWKFLNIIRILFGKRAKIEAKLNEIEIIIPTFLEILNPSLRSYPGKDGVL